MNEATTIEKSVKEHISNENDDYKNEQYHKILKDLKEYIQPMQSIDEQLQDLKQNKESLGIMKFDWDEAKEKDTSISKDDIARLQAKANQFINTQN